MNENNSIGKWELGCIIFNSLVFKLFLFYPKIYLHFGGSAAWLTAVFSGAVFLVIFWLIMLLYDKYADVGIVEAVKRKFGSNASNAISLIGVVYFIVSFCAAVFYVCCALRKTVFPTSPLWYTVVFVVLAALVTMLCGSNAVRRMHSLSSLGVGVTIAAIFVFGLKNADIYNLTPVLGKGAGNVFLKGLSSMFMYSDIIAIFFLPRNGGKYSYKKTALFSAVLAVVANVLIILIFSLNFPYEYAEGVEHITYALTKGASAGKFPIRIDFAYLLALITSAILYCSLALCIIVNEIRKISFKIKRAGAAVMSLILCLTLCGCYDSSEVEEKGYVIAIGIDKGDNSEFKYTFQLSNPLESGGSMGTEEKADEKQSDGNNTVDNICVEADDFFTAKNKLKSVLSKKADFSNVKVVALSNQVAEEDALSHCVILLKDREVRPSANICVAGSAVDFLKSVNPTLEENTIRYYELFFKNRDVPYATVITLREFVSRSVDKAYDAVAPLVNESGLSGMALFQSGKMCGAADDDEALIYNLLIGNAEGAGFNYGTGECTLSSVCKPDINVSTDNVNPYIILEIKVDVSEGADLDKVARQLKNRTETFLYKTSTLSCDILGLGRKVKSDFATQFKWESYNWNILYNKSVFSVNVIAKNGKNN